jgi:hypothetical protein
MLLGTSTSRPRPWRYVVTAVEFTLELFIIFDDEDVVRFVGFAHAQ